MSSPFFSKYDFTIIFCRVETNELLSLWGLVSPFSPSHTRSYICVCPNHQNTITIITTINIKTIHTAPVGDALRRA